VGSLQGDCRQGVPPQHCPLTLAHHTTLLLAHHHQGILTDTTPFHLIATTADSSSGTPGCPSSFWDHLKRSPRHAATFDGAMRQKDALGGAALAAAYPWGRFDCVVDVAGGNGQLLARLLRRHSRLEGILFDQEQQVERGKQVGVCVCVCVAFCVAGKGGAVCNPQASTAFLTPTPTLPPHPATPACQPPTAIFSGGGSSTKTSSLGSDLQPATCFNPLRCRRSSQGSDRWRLCCQTSCTTVSGLPDRVLCANWLGGRVAFSSSTS